MTEQVDIRVEVDPAFRKQFKKVAVEDEVTYEELLELLIGFREAHDAEWESYTRGSDGRRPTGTRNTET